MTKKGQFKPFNEYETREDHACLFYKDKTNKLHEILIDLDILDLLIQIGYSWRASYRADTDSYYAQSILHDLELIEKYGTKHPYLQKIVLKADVSKNEYVHHKSHNTLDNRRSNLEILTNSNNNKHRKSKNKNNGSGYRNVSWNKYYKKWSVQLQIQGKNTVLGMFEDVDEAGVFAQEMRKIHYGKHAGND